MSMSTDAALFDEEIQDVLDRAAQLIKQSSPTQATDLLDRKSKVRNLIHQLKAAVRLLDSEAERRIYTSKITQHNQRLADLRQQIAVAAAGPSEQSRLRVPTNHATIAVGDGKDEAREATKRITNISNTTVRSLEQTLLTVHKTEEVSHEVTQQLGSQTRQMEDNNKRLDEVEGQVKKARSELNAFIRRMMTDKILLCLSILIVVGVIAVVAIKVTGDNNDPAASKPAPAPTAQPATQPPTTAQKPARAISFTSRTRATPPASVSPAAPVVPSRL